MRIYLGEDVDHLPLNCQVAAHFWWVVLDWFEVQRVMTGTVKEALHNGAFRRRKRRLKAWDVVPLALM